MKSRLFLQIDIPEIVVHKADQPDAVVHFLDADGLTGQPHAEIDFLAIEAQPAAAGDHDGAMVKRVVRLRDASVQPWRGNVVPTLAIEPFYESVDFCLR